MNDIKRVVSLLRQNATRSTGGYIIVFLTGIEASIPDKLTGETREVLLFHIIGPLSNPRNEVLEVANALDGFNLPAYNIRVIDGIIDPNFFKREDGPSLSILPNVESYVRWIGDTTSKWRINQNLDDALGLDQCQ